ncbi:MAG: PRTRC system protein C [Thiobacillus sp.]|jgi:PRTRC genetic system protein C|uniref:PRTRC system protein C n=1 Tax=Hydrogenophaga aromaticivorans TaxID=2610898 RepID=A0A7Y8GWK2_9BURK|nr:PRTRC system protein C [Hydrogenophaga aromaticivorans]MBW8471097.1 PRTRC system protein C [Thiobacillus sp.]NWF46160.1 PRTRC system protein C [Hydrogenophaga aromaticivorans]
MAIAEVKLVRKFRYQGITLSDPASDKTPEQVMKVYAFQYPELLNAVVEGPVTKNGVSTYTFARVAGSKGAVGHHKAVRSIAAGTFFVKDSPLANASKDEIKENKECSKTVQTVVNMQGHSQAILPGSMAFSRFG